MKRYSYVVDCGIVEDPAGEYVMYKDYIEMSDYADSLVEFGKLPCLPKDLEVLRAANSELAREVHMLRQVIHNMKSEKNAEDMQRRINSSGSFIHYPVDAMISINNPSNTIFS